MRLRAHLSGGDQGGRATIGGSVGMSCSARPFWTLSRIQTTYANIHYRKQYVLFGIARIGVRVSQQKRPIWTHRATPASTSIGTPVLSIRNLAISPLTARTPRSNREYVVSEMPNLSAASRWLMSRLSRQSRRSVWRFGVFIIDAIPQRLRLKRTRCQPSLKWAIISRSCRLWEPLRRAQQYR